MLLANRSGQDIEYRLGGGGANAATRWILLRKGTERQLTASSHPCTLEVRAEGKPVLQKALAKPHDLVEILHQADSGYKAKVTMKATAKDEKAKNTRSTPPKGAELRS